MQNMKVFLTATDNKLHTELTQTDNAKFLYFFHSAAPKKIIRPHTRIINLNLDIHPCPLV